MRQAGESNADACDFNDFALIRAHPADAPNVNPTIPFWGGPTGITGSVPDGEEGALVRQLVAASRHPRAEPQGGPQDRDPGQRLEPPGYTGTPGIPGDSGSAFIDRRGRAFGVLSTVQIAPAAGSNGVGELSREIAYVESHGGPDATLANGTEPFAGPLLP